MKTLTIQGKRYRLQWSTHHQRIVVNGPKLLRNMVYLDSDTTFESEDLREKVFEAVADYHQRHRLASEAVQEAVRAGRAGLSN